MLAPITTNKYTVQDSFTSVKEICDMNFEQNALASFDVKSLFTNIPLSETIDICIDSVFKDTDETENFSKPQLHKLLSLVASDCCFLFNQKGYKQKDVVAIGNPLGPTLANAFLAYHEVNWLNECPVEFKPLIYRCYVDDTFLVFKSPDHVFLFLEYINSKHPDIELMFDVESNGKL